jgi:hypothetical protein
MQYSSWRKTIAGYFQPTEGFDAEIATSPDKNQESRVLFKWANMDSENPGQLPTN